MQNRTAFSTYRATAGSNIVVTTGKAVLHRILIGKDVATSTVDVSDSPTSASADIRVHAEGSALMTANGGCIEVGAVFATGITATLTNQTNVTFIWEPIA